MHLARDSAMNIPAGSPTKAPQSQSSHLSYFRFMLSLLGRLFVVEQFEDDEDGEEDD